MMIEKEILEEVKEKITEHSYIYRSIKNQVQEDLNDMKLLNNKPRIFVRDMVTYIHAPKLQSEIMSNLIKKYGDYNVELALFQLFKISDYKVYDIDQEVEDPREKWR